jgi:chromosomal replication initiation ATPase DnaA
MDKEKLINFYQLAIKSLQDDLIEIDVNQSDYSVIANNVCQVTNSNITDLKSKSRKREFSDARILYGFICYINRLELKYSQEKISMLINKDRCSYIHWKNKGEELLETKDKRFCFLFNSYVEKFGLTIKKDEKICTNEN